MRSVCKCYLLRSVVIVVDGDAANTTNAMPCHRYSSPRFVLICFPSIYVPGPFFSSIYHSFTFFFIIRRRAALLVITHFKRARCTLIAVPWVLVCLIYCIATPHQTQCNLPLIQATVKLKRQWKKFLLLSISSTLSPCLHFICVRFVFHSFTVKPSALCTSLQIDVYFSLCTITSG